MASIRVPDCCVERWSGATLNTVQMPNGNMRVERHMTEDIILLSKEFLAWAGSSIPQAELVAVYVSGERDTFEIRGSDDDIMLVRMKWYGERPVPPAEELPEYLYVTAPYSYHLESTTVPSNYKRVP